MVEDIGLEVLGIRWIQVADPLFQEMDVSMVLFLAAREPPGGFCGAQALLP